MIHLKKLHSMCFENVHFHQSKHLADNRLIYYTLLLQHNEDQHSLKKLIKKKIKSILNNKKITKFKKK